MIGALRRLTLAIAAALTLPTLAAVNGAGLDAARKTAETAPTCKALGDFYWEIGDRLGVIINGSVGRRYNAQTPMKIASASKWVWGAYAVERAGGVDQLTPLQIDQLEMRSGHTSFGFVACPFAKTVASCLERGSNAHENPNDIGKFHYGGGHDQQMAVDLGLGDNDSTQLTREVQRRLGGDLGLSYHRPNPAGGMQGTPDAYARFLRRILNGELKIADALGAKPVCTLPSVCRDANYSPVPEAWHYSLNHWVEDDPETGDGAYSSPGLEGFYPWISADKRLYGLVAREQLRRNAAIESVLCGREIRRAYINGSSGP